MRQLLPCFYNSGNLSGGFRFSREIGSMIFCFADQLRHGSHRAVDAPASRFEQYHSDKSKDGGCQHNAVKAKGKLSNTFMKECSMICPLPGILNVHSNVTACVRSCASANTR